MFEIGVGDCSLQNTSMFDHEECKAYTCAVKPLYGDGLLWKKWQMKKIKIFIGHVPLMEEWNPKSRVSVVKGVDEVTKVEVPNFEIPVVVGKKRILIPEEAWKILLKPFKPIPCVRDLVKGLLDYEFNFPAWRNFGFCLICQILDSWEM